jgi:hypothetical protein
VLPAFSVDVLTDYTIQAKATFTGGTDSSVASVKFSVAKSKLSVFILGGNRMQAYNKNWQAVGQAKDPDYGFNYNEDPALTYEWACTDLNAK